MRFLSEVELPEKRGVGRIMLTIESVIVYISAIWTDISALALWKILGSLLFLVFGGHEVAVYGLTALLIIDLITGTWVALRQGKFEGRIGRAKTAAKFFMYLLIISAGRAADYVLISEGLQLFGGTIMTASLVYLSLTELLSITQNATSLGYPMNIPILRDIQKYMSQLQDKKDDKEAAREARTEARVEAAQVAMQVAQSVPEAQTVTVMSTEVTLKEQEKQPNG
jgi:phage-related holin